MKKIILSLAIAVFCVGHAYGAQGYIFTPENTKQTAVYNQSLQLKNIPYASYLKYYNLNPEKIDADFIKFFDSSNHNILNMQVKNSDIFQKLCSNHLYQLISELF